ncbi:MAG TPA: uracil-DNA glycosylase [Thiolapillus brandeum]|uniref:Uracil-DNA glycosylase n=1 Tax=Thiolapillus brandeum TaxID=1076588 RepID=A0A7C5N8V3_9GAMM|nr:uracil-DNA glycosylase [Thiolapillus brandeum]
MIPPVVVGRPVLSPVISIGQAPGEKEGPAGKPFAWTAGKTLFQWFESIGVDEETYRSRVYMAAVCRCFPGKNPKGGDRVPSREEIDNCRIWMEREFHLLRPRLVIPIGKLAIAEIMHVKRLVEVIGRSFEEELFGVRTTVIPLPHPSGASTWHRTEPGKTLLAQALERIAEHPAWRETFR